MVLPRGAFGLVLAGLVLVFFASSALPVVKRGEIPGPDDAREYAYLSAALLHGSYLVDYDGPPRPARYTPGFPILLLPAIAVGGLESSIWVPYLSALLLGALAAGLAWRLGGGLAAPIAVGLVLFNDEMFYLASVIMSDVPSTTIALAEVALLSVGSGRSSAVGAGVLAGALVWVRPGSLVLVLAAAAGLSATSSWKLRLGWYAAGAALPVLLLAVWQSSAFGSPFVTSYQATGASGNGSADLSSFFSWAYVFGPPWNTYGVGTEANAFVYARALLGFDNPETLPGIGLLGLVGAALLARRSGAVGCFGRFTLAANVLTLLLYVPYFFRDVRFLMIPVTLNDIAAAVMLARAMSLLRSALPGARDTRTSPRRGPHCDRSERK